MEQRLLMQELYCENEHAILEGFMDRYRVSYQEAEDIFRETKKWSIIILPPRVKRKNAAKNFLKTQQTLKKNAKSI